MATIKLVRLFNGARAGSEDIEATRAALDVALASAGIGDGWGAELHGTTAQLESVGAYRAFGGASWVYEGPDRDVLCVEQQ